MMHFWVDNGVEELIEDFTIVEGSIKRSIRMDLIAEEYYAELKMVDGICLDTPVENGQIGTSSVSAIQPIANIEAFQRNKSGNDNSFGSLMICNDGGLRKSLGMNSMFVDTVISMLNFSIAVQKILEEKNIISTNPEDDIEDLNIYVGVEDEEIVARIIDNGDDFELTTYED